MKVYEIMSRVVVGRGETIHCIRLNPDGGKVEESRISEEEALRGEAAGGHTAGDDRKGVAAAGGGRGSGAEVGPDDGNAKRTEEEGWPWLGE